MIRNLASIDFETEPIEARPRFPPEPVGVALGLPGRRSRYLAWGHPEGNNCTKAQAKAQLRDTLRDHPVLAFNGQFDWAVAEAMGLKLPPPERIHDAQTLAFLWAPDSKRLALKELAQDHLGREPVERDDLRSWVFANVPEAKGKPKTWKEWGAYICRAPVRLVSPYACADADMARELFNLLHPKVTQERGMGRAYALEQRLLPALMEMEREGIPIDAERLALDLRVWEARAEAADDWLRKQLGAPALDVDSNEQLADAMESAGAVRPCDWVFTAPSKTYPQGQRSVSQDNLAKALEGAARRGGKHRELIAVMRYRSKLCTSIRTFARPWLAVAAMSGGLIYCGWNSHGTQDGHAAPRTGRLSSSPNLQNVPKNPDRVAFSKAQASVLQAEAERLDVKVMTLPNALQRSLGPLPELRDYVLARKSGRARDWILNPDYSQQELRLLAHYEDGALRDAYRATPEMDLHQHVRELILASTGLDYPRRYVKNTNFGILYGMGLAKLAGRIDLDPESDEDVLQARELRAAVYEAMPGVRLLDKDLKTRGKRGEPIRTYGGRVYYCEPPRIIKGHLKTFEYKLLNTLIQGSAGDMTKQAMVNYYEHPRREGYLMLSVHDELMAGCAANERTLRREAAILAESMVSVELDLPVLVDMRVSRSSWGRVEKFAA